MNSNLAPRLSILADTLAHPTVGEYHHGVVDAPREQVWQALQQLRWADLRLARPFLLARGFAFEGGLTVRCLDTFRSRAVMAERSPEVCALVMVGQPWHPRPRSVELASPEQAREFTEPGWLRYGMDWRFSALPGNRTLVETSTLCEPTDDTARLRFGLYWWVVRPFSGLVRREMIAALGRLAPTIRLDPTHQE